MGRWLRILTATVLLAGTSLSGQSGWGGWGRSERAYDGRFTFVRLRWEPGYGGSRRGGFGDAWNHDFPRAEQNLLTILEDLTLIDANADGSLILTLDDPQLFKYPIVYMWEPGFWIMTDFEAQRFREYLLKGGFAIFDDFEDDQWNNFEAQMRRVLPSLRHFQRQFADEEACRQYLEACRWPDGFRCPRCGQGRAFPLRGWQRRECAACRYQASLTAGTVFHRTKTPLTVWFWAAYLMTTDKRGISALLLQWQLGLRRYETAWMLLHKLRRAMVNAAREPLHGEVELEEWS